MGPPGGPQYRVVGLSLNHLVSAGLGLWARIIPVPGAGAIAQGEEHLPCTWLTGV